MTILRDISTMWACCFSFVMFLILFEPRLPMRRTVLLSVIIMGPLLTANFVLLFLLGPETMSTLLLITATLPSLVFFWFLAKYRDGRFFFTFCMSDTIMLLIIHSTTILDFFLGDTYILMFVLRLIACPLLAWASYRWFRPVYLEIQTQVFKGWYIFTAIALLFYVILSMSISVPNNITQRLDQLPVHVLLLILMPVIYTHIFTTLRHQQKLHEMTQQENILKLQVAGTAARMEELTAADEQFRVERHDFRHKMQVIADMAARQEYDKLQDLATNYRDSVPETQVRRYCTNPVVDAVLSSYLQKAERKGIRVETALSFPDSIPVRDDELATVFANALENAIHACEKLPREKGWIQVKVLMIPRFMIQVSNSYNGIIAYDKEGIPVSQKDGHGFGTRSIVTFCQKNKAFYEFKATEEKFQLRISF